MLWSVGCQTESNRLNNYAISTSEAATALQSSASALKTAGNDMDEALALITAGNAVVQDANKVGIKDAQR